MKKILVITLLLVLITAFAACSVVNVDFVALEGEHYVTDVNMLQYSPKLIEGKNYFARFVYEESEDIDCGFDEFVIVEIGILIAEDVSRVNIDRVGKVGKTLRVYVSYPNNAYKSDRRKVTLIQRIAVPKADVDGVTSVKVSLKLY